MTTNLHDKMLTAIDAYFSASNEIEAHIAEEQLLDVRDSINKQPSQPSQQEPEIVQRVKRYAGQTLRTARNPNITARECIELADWLAAHGITKGNT